MLGKLQPKLSSLEEQQATRQVVLSSTAVVLAASGVLLRMPLVGAASLPLMLYVFLPTFKTAWQLLRTERKVNVQVLMATRVTVCLVMGYSFIAALDALLHSLSQRFFLKTENTNRQQVAAACQQFATLPDNLADNVYQACFSVSQIQQKAEQQGELTAPWMLVACAISTPLMGINRAAAFLTTTFGAHLHRLGPYTQQKQMLQALHEGIFILRPGVLERAMQIDTIIFDASIFNDFESQQINAMLAELYRSYVQDAGSKPLALHLIGIDNLAPSVKEIAIDSAHCWSSEHNLEDLIDALQGQGRQVCYIATGNNESQSANLTIHYGQQFFSTTPLSDVVLLGNNLQQLPGFFQLAGRFTTKQRFNFIAPIGIDVVDIATTVFFDFGLIYSVMFTYSGLLVGVVNNEA